MQLRCYDSRSMQSSSFSQSDSNRAFAVEVVRRLQSAGYLAYWAGGCVRDQLRGTVPKDYDVATNATPETVRGLFGHGRTLAIGAAFGVISLLGPRGIRQVEVATFRHDNEYSDGRHPDSVRFSDPREDAQRRDFTINGLFFDPLTDQVLDFVGGQADLQQGLIRAIGDPFRRFDEDKLRMLRAVRFAATLGFQIEPRTLAAIQKLAGELVIVSAERIAGEMERVLLDGARRRGVELLRASNLLEIVIPELTVIEEEDADRNWATTLAILEQLGDTSFPAAIATLVRNAAPIDQRPSVGAQVCQRWRLSAEITKRTVALLKYEPSILEARRLAWPRLQRLLVKPFATELLDYTATIAQVRFSGDPSGPVGDVEYCRERLAWPQHQLNPPPLINGDDLVASGLQPGPRFRQILEQIRDAQLEGRITTRESALAMGKMLSSALGDGE
ncbi:MAG: CCA tRNA nucleotidyltransferase [Planctomycetes bacterium]|nr:CCA tRNA nucleotidyltransferase [Planctomycetota bacterium]